MAIGTVVSTNIGGQVTDSFGETHDVEFKDGINWGDVVTNNGNTNMEIEIPPLGPSQGAALVVIPPGGSIRIEEIEAGVIDGASRANVIALTEGIELYDISDDINSAILTEADPAMAGIFGAEAGLLAGSSMGAGGVAAVAGGGLLVAGLASGGSDGTSPADLNNGDGSGDGSGNGSGDGSGNGSGDGSGNGSGDGSGNGSGDGSGNGSGDGSGNGSGDGSGNGTGGDPLSDLLDNGGTGGDTGSNPLDPITGGDTGGGTGGDTGGDTGGTPLDGLTGGDTGPTGLAAALNDVGGGLGDATGEDSPLAPLDPAVDPVANIVGSDNNGDLTGLGSVSGDLGDALTGSDTPLLSDAVAPILGSSGGSGMGGSDPADLLATDTSSPITTDPSQGGFDTSGLPIDTQSGF